MATVIGIFQQQYKLGKPLTVVKPGTQTRRFTHIDDTIKVCIEAWKKNKNIHYSISSKKSIQFFKLQRCLIQKLNIYLNDLESDTLRVN